MTTIIVTIIPIMLLDPTVSPPLSLLAYTRLSYSLPHSRELRFSSVGNGGLQAREGCARRWVASIHRAAEKAHSRKLVVASPATNIPFYSAQSSVTPCSCHLLPR